MDDAAVVGRKRTRLLGGRSFSSDINNPRASAFQCASSSAASTPRPCPKGRNGRTKPSTQTGTPRWTHHPVTHSKQTTGVEPARNSIPTPSTLVWHGSLLPPYLIASLHLCLRHSVSTRQWLPSRKRRNLLKTKVRSKIYPSLIRAVRFPGEIEYRTFGRGCHHR